MNGLPSSFRVADLSVSRRAVSMLVAISTRYHCKPWNSDSFLPERLALLDVGQRRVVGGLRYADALGGYRHAAGVQNLHRHAEAVALVAHAVLFLHGAVVEDDLRRRGRAYAHLAVQGVYLDSGRVGFYDERVDAPGSQCPVLRRHYNHSGGFRRVGDECLAAVQDVAAVGARSGRPERGGVRPRARLGERERAYLFAGHQRGYELALLALRAEHFDVLRAERQVRAEYGGGGGAGAGYLLDGDYHLAGRSAAAAVVLVYAQPQYAELRQSPDVVVGEVAALVIVGGARREFGVGEFADGVSQHQFFFVEK